MKLIHSSIVFLLVIALSLASLGAWADPTNLVDQNEPNNDDCAGAESWPGLTADSSTGQLGVDDAYDWSRIQLYRTESLTPSIAPATASVHYAESCGGLPTTGAPLYAAQSGWYYLRTSSTAGGTTNYTVNYEITANDAGTDADVGNSAASAHSIDPNVLLGDPREHGFYSGSLPNRADQPNGPDQDWFLVAADFSPLDTGPTSGWPAVSLLSLTFWPECATGGTYRFSLYASDGTTQIGTPLSGCGAMTKSCIATNSNGTPSVYAKLEVLPGSEGASYDFNADMNPVYFLPFSLGRPDGAMVRPLSSPHPRGDDDCHNDGALRG